MSDDTTPPTDVPALDRRLLEELADKDRKAALLVEKQSLERSGRVKEREIGTFEMLLATPVSPSELVVGKLTPFVAIGRSSMFAADRTGWPSASYPRCRLDVPMNAIALPSGAPP
mgnify:CR=1 FL=1